MIGFSFFAPLETRSGHGQKTDITRAPFGAKKYNLKTRSISKFCPDLARGRAL